LSFVVYPSLSLLNNGSHIVAEHNRYQQVEKNNHKDMSMGMADMLADMMGLPQIPTAATTTMETPTTTTATATTTTTTTTTSTIVSGGGATTDPALYEDPNLGQCYTRDTDWQLDGGGLFQDNDLPLFLTKVGELCYGVDDLSLSHLKPRLDDFASFP